MVAAAGVPGRPLSAQQAPAGAIARAHEIVDQAMRRGAAPAAAAAVAIGGRIVWSEAFGSATRATQFGIGSISKALTFAAALALADAGQVDLDAPIETYLPDFPHRGQGVTLRRIGAHQSGIADEFADGHYYSTEHFDRLEDAYRRIAAAPLAFPPGSRSEYATGIFTIAGRVLERVSGETYLEVIHRRVFAPAGMGATVPNDPRRPTKDRAGFYIRGGSGFDPAPAFDPSFKLPGAGFLSTAEDLTRFGSALLRPGLLSEKARRELFTPVPLADGTPTRYALGFQALSENGRRLLLQPGGGPGIAAWLAIYPDDDLVVAILANATNAPLGDEVRRAVADGFLRPPAPAPSRPPGPAPVHPPGT